jgi:hypothetical protein
MFTPTNSFKICNFCQVVIAYHWPSKNQATPLYFTGDSVRLPTDVKISSLSAEKQVIPGFVCLNLYFKNVKKKNCI